MWQPQAQPPSCLTASRRLDRASEASQRIAQTGILDICQRGGNARRRLRIGLRLGTSGRSAQRRLPQPDRADRLPPEKPIHPLQDYSREVLNLQRDRSFDAQDEPARLRQLSLA